MWKLICLFVLLGNSCCFTAAIADNSIINSAIHLLSPVVFTEREQAFLREHPVITLGTGDAWEPYVIVNNDGQVTGYDAEVLAAIKNLTGLNIRLLPGDWRERQEQAKLHEIDGLSTGGIHPERTAYLNFSEPYIRLHKLVLVTKGNPLNIRTRADLDGRTIAIHRGNLSDEKVALQFPRSNIILFDSIDEIIRAVSTGRVDAAFDNGSLLYRANRIGSPYLQFAVSLNETLELAFGVRKDWPEAISIINKGLHALGEEERVRIQADWFMSAVKLNDTTATQPSLTAKETAFLNRLGAIRLCIDPDWMPFEAVTARGQTQGIFSDLVDLIMQRLNRQVELVKTSDWEQSLTTIYSGHCDIIAGAAITPERSEYLDFTQPLLIEPLVVAVHTDSTFDGNLDRYLDQSFIMVSSHAAIELMRRHHPAMRITEAKNVVTALRAVTRGDAFGYIDLLPTIAWTAQHHSIFNLKITGNLSEQYALAIGVRKEMPLLLSALSKAVATIRLEEIKTIRDRWTSVRYEQAADYRWLWPYIAAGVLLLIVMILWNRRLHQLNDALRSANERIELLTITDELTQLFNRRHFQFVMEREWRRAMREMRNLYLLLIDVDHFKLYNDYYGHPAGDEVLKRIGELMCQQTRRGSEFAFRVGGEEFAVLLTTADQTSALAFAEDLRQATERLAIPHRGNAAAPVVTLSIGLLCVIPPIALRTGLQLLDWESIYQQADALLYHAKHAGRNRVMMRTWQADMVTTPTSCG
ncbi:transporter substrate-binding domain-containing protein [Thiospirillum jenense]|uniref:diguanylate cyclase n=1 Tax=Thiospirillum jenense TaxID=1653858 RepID=A0A839HEQ5_9GAMM|nr:transporter substrate-binding domain-containing protein [Thiospirillum jenense]MBB1125667.1 transporter substrate-binding domain-containing protein [Thiospirillum jenense]